jgi:hypothetical protein
MRVWGWLGLTVLAVSVAACGGGKRYVTVTVPPRLDLGQYERVALTTFTVENAKGTLHEFASQRFAESILQAQRNVEVLEVGAPGAVLQQVGERTFGPGAAKTYGNSHDVPAVFAGHLKVSNVKPSGGLTSFAIPHVEATVSVEMSVALFSTRSGGTLWRSGAAASEKVGHLSILRGGEPTFSAKDPAAAYGRLVDQLVSAVSRDLYPTYERH